MAFAPAAAQPADGGGGGCKALDKYTGHLNATVSSAKGPARAEFVLEARNRLLKLKPV